MSDRSAADPESLDLKRAWFLRAAAVILAVRLVVVAAAVLSLQTAEPGDVDERYAGDMALVAWDSLHYQRILETGYPRDSPQPIIAFFPGYPAMAWPASLFIDSRLALLLVANVCSLAGLLVMFQWASPLIGARAAFFATSLAACFPPSMFLAAAYVQGPMFLAIALGLLLVQRGRWIGAGAASGAATALHPTGVAFAAALGLSMFRRHVRPSRFVVISAISLAGLLTYQGFLWARYGQFDAYFRAQDNWSATDDGAEIHDSPELMMRSTQDRLAEKLPGPMQKLASIGAWNKAWLGLMIIIAVMGLVRPGAIPRELFVLPIMIFLLGYLPGHGARVTSIARLETVALPCFALAGMWLSRIPLRLVAPLALFVMVLLQAWNAFAFSRGEWAG